MSGREYEDGAFYWVRQFQSDDEAGPWTIGRWDEWGWTVLGDRVGFSVVEVGPCLGKEPPTLDPRGNPARVLQGIMEAQGWPVDQETIERAAAYCDELIPKPPTPRS
jgi:hypothetical protein